MDDDDDDDEDGHEQEDSYVQRRFLTMAIQPLAMVAHFLVDFFAVASSRFSTCPKCLCPMSWNLDDKLC
jgi:hypothetical protein